MTAIYIVLSVLLLLFAIAMLPVSLTLEYKDNVALNASVLAVKIPLYPKKKAKASDPKTKKAKKKKAFIKKSAIKKADKKPNQEEKSLLESLKLIRELLVSFFGGIAKHVKIKTTRIIINVAAADAAKTALLYGAVNNAVLFILTFLDKCKKVKSLKSSEISVNADFLSEKSSADVKITFTLRVWHLIKIIFASALKYVTYKSK